MSYEFMKLYSKYYNALKLYIFYNIKSIENLKSYVKCIVL